MFTAPRGGPLSHSHFAERRWRKALDAAREKGLFKTPRFHDLRHTHASWLVAANVPMLLVQKRLGHESITTTEIYSDLLDQTHQAADAAIEAALTGQRIAPAAPARFVTETGADGDVTLNPDDDALPEIDVEEAA